MDFPCLHEQAKLLLDLRIELHLPEDGTIRSQQQVARQRHVKQV